MEHVRMKDDNSSPNPTGGNPAAPRIQADPPPPTLNRTGSDPEFPARPSTSSSTADFQYSDKSWLPGLPLHLKSTGRRFEPPRSKPLLQGFETPRFSRIAILTTLCLITYPAFCILKLVAKDRSLFVVRAIVSVWCSGVGLALGYILLEIGARHLEAATWATVIHTSHEGSGTKLRDLARSSSNPMNFMPAFHIFWSRFRDRGTSRRSRKSYDKRPWSLFIAFFVILAILAPLLPFILGRIVEIKVFVRNQREVYSEVLIAGDLSEEDISQAGAHGIFTTSYPDTAEFVYDNHIVYLSQPSLSQLIPGGSGAGAFNQPTPLGVKYPPSKAHALTGGRASKSDTGAVLRYPQWGIRIHCEKLPNPAANMILESPNTGYTYAFIPRDFLQRLFGVYGMDLPTEFAKPDLSVLDANDTIPSNINLSTISSIVRFPHGTALQLSSAIVPHVASNQEWVTVETVVIRLNTSLTPSGRFPAYLNESLPGLGEVMLGFDAAVCVQKYEPWIVEAYNTSTGSSFALRIVGKQDDTSLSPSGTIRGAQMENTRYLNATGKDFVLFAAHNATVERFWEVNQIRDQIPDSYYTPTPTIVSFTTGTGPGGYTEFSPGRFAAFRARAGAVNVLPYLVGSGPVVAQSYKDGTLAYTTFKPWQLIVLLVLVLILGTIGELFVPALPLNIPRRGFGLYSWLALLRSQELQFDAVDDLGKLTSLNELEECFSDKRVKFVV